MRTVFLFAVSCLLVASAPRRLAWADEVDEAGRMTTTIDSVERRDQFLERFRALGSEPDIHGVKRQLPWAQSFLMERLNSGMKYDPPQFPDGTLGVAGLRDDDVSLQTYMRLVAECPYVADLSFSPGEASDADLLLLQGHPGIQKIKMGRNKMTDVGLAVLPSLPKLESLTCGVSIITDETLQILSRCKNLRILSLSHVESTDAGFEALAHLKKLQFLELMGTPICRGVRHLTYLPLTSLNLSKTLVDDESLKSIGEITTLRELSIGETAITDDGLKHLAGLQNLESLSLYDNAITAKGLREIQRLPHLDSLSLSGVPLDDDAVHVLAEMQNLRSLFIMRTPITKDQLNYLDEHLPDKCRIYADDETDAK
ncbi:MAG: hypothetical protein KDA86_16140 [Planctomycetaceae bacterium]|nr:hypothetical protein [Planctomycetaceae bacterium]